MADRVTDVLKIESGSHLEDLLCRPNEADLDWIRRLKGDLMILGAGGKMGPSLAVRAVRAVREAGLQKRVMAVSRFSSAAARQLLETEGIETQTCDFLDREQVSRLPFCENVLYLAGRKFGTDDRSDITWAANTVAPANISSHFRKSRLVVFSTGNVYPLVDVNGTGCSEADAPDPVGEYAQSCLGRERVTEYFSREYGTPCLIYRLNYAVDLRYGVLVDIAWKVRQSLPVNLTVGYANVIWQGDANSIALRSLDLCESPPRVLNVTGLDKISIKETAEWFAQRWRQDVRFEGSPGAVALLSDASLCRNLMGDPEVSQERLMHWVAHWVESGGTYLGKPTKFEVSNGRF